LIDLILSKITVVILAWRFLLLLLVLLASGVSFAREEGDRFLLDVYLQYGRRREWPPDS